MHCQKIEIEKEKQRAEEDLKISEEKFSVAFKTSPYAIVITQPESGRFIEVNDAFFTMTGFTHEELENNSSIEMGLWVDIEDRNRVVKELYGGRDMIRQEFKFKKKNGEIIIGLFSAHLIHIKNRTYILASINDITESKRADEALRKSEMQLSTALDIAHLGPWEYDVIKDEFTFNDHFYKLFRENAEQVGGYKMSSSEYIRRFVHPDDIAAVSQEIEKVIESDDPNYCRAMEHRIIYGDGEIGYISVKILTIKDSSGQMIRTYGVNQDITYLKNKEQELIIARQHAEESDKLKTAFLQNMSHEIRTPLNGIIGYSNLLKNENLSKEEINEFTYIIQQSGNRLIEIVNNVLYISKIQTGQFKIDNKPILINSIFSDLLSFFSQSAKTKNIILNYHNLDDKNRMLYSDKEMLYQILTNLINNAIKFTKSGSIDFGYEINDKPSEGLKPSEGCANEDTILFYVKDTGIGIPTELYDEIFKRFIQIESTLSRGYEGAGLGLAICKGLVELLEGKIWIESEINKGTTFFFTLPYTFVALASESCINNSDGQVKRTHGKILIAEDDLISYKYLNRLLVDSNITVLHAENGEQAVELVRNTSDIDLILMDIRMPRMDGIEATKRIKLIRPDLPIIAQTAYAFTEERDKILSIGCDGYLSKPIDIKNLVKMINKYLS